MIELIRLVRRIIFSRSPYSRCWLTIFFEVPFTSRIDVPDQNTASAPSVIICEYCRSRGDKFLQQQLATFPVTDNVETHGTKYQAGDMVKVRVRSKGQRVRVEQAVIADIGQSSVFLAWLFETEKTKTRKQLLKGKIGPSHKLILSSHADTVPVDALAGLISPDEKKVVCTNWVLHSDAAQTIRMAELHDGCFMRSLIEKFRTREPSEGSAAPSGTPDNTAWQQKNGGLAHLQDQASAQSEVSASSSGPEALELEKQRKEEEGMVGAGARNRVGGKTKEMREQDLKRRKRRQILEAPGISPDDYRTKEENGNSSNNNCPRSASGARYSNTAKRPMLDAPSSNVSPDIPRDGPSSVPTLPDQLDCSSDSYTAGGEERRTPFSQRSAIRNALETNCFEEYTNHASLTVDDIHTLIPKDKNEQLPCLNDNVVDGYITMLTKKACEKDGCLEADESSNKVRSYGAVTCLWWRSKNFLLQNKGLLSSVNNLFLPFCDGGHWRLLVVSGKRKTIQYFDSLSYPSEGFVDRVREWIKLTLGDAYNENDWKTVEEQRSPQQDNTVDCGVAVLLNARAIVMGLLLHPNLYSFERKVMLAVRYELAVDLLSSTVDLRALPSAIQMKDPAGIDKMVSFRDVHDTERQLTFNGPRPKMRIQRRLFRQYTNRILAILWPPWSMLSMRLTSGSTAPLTR